MPRICKTTPRDENGKPVRVRCLATAKSFIEKLLGLEDGSASFTRYMTVNGYSSYAVVKDQPSQGLLKTSLADVYELKRRASNGDPEAVNALFVMAQYMQEFNLDSGCGEGDNASGLRSA